MSYCSQADVEALLHPHTSDLVATDAFGSSQAVRARIRALLPVTKRAVDWLAGREFDPSNVCEQHPKISEAQAKLTAAAVLAQAGLPYTGHPAGQLPRVILPEYTRDGVYASIIDSWVEQARESAGRFRRTGQEADTQ